MKGFADADWTNSLIDRKSYTGYVFTLGGGAISWESKKQNSVALSSTEAEYVAISEAAKEAVYIRGFLKKITDLNDSIVIYNDNQSAQKLVYNPIFHNRTKHIEVKYHFIREIVDKKIIEVEYMPTEEMLADVFTKSLYYPKHNNCLKGIGLYIKNVSNS